MGFYYHLLSSIHPSVHTSLDNIEVNNFKTFYESLKVVQKIQFMQKIFKIIFSETINASAKIFGMKHHVVNLYQACVNKIGPVQGSHCFPCMFILVLIIIFFDTIKAGALVFGMKHTVMDHYQACSNYNLLVKIGHASGVMGLPCLHEVKSISHIL
jgi:hypothetical protein